MPECQGCGGRVSHEYVRVMGKNGRVTECLHCQNPRGGGHAR